MHNREEGMNIILLEIKGNVNYWAKGTTIHDRLHIYVRIVKRICSRQIVSKTYSKILPRHNVKYFKRMKEKKIVSTMCREKETHGGKRGQQRLPASKRVREWGPCALHVCDVLSPKDEKKISYFLAAQKNRPHSLTRHMLHSRARVSVL